MTEFGTVTGRFSALPAWLCVTWERHARLWPVNGSSVQRQRVHSPA